MTRTQKAVFIAAAIVALLLGVILSQVLPGRSSQDQAALNDAGIVLLPKPPIASPEHDRPERRGCSA